MDSWWKNVFLARNLCDGGVCNDGWKAGRKVSKVYVGS